MPFVITIAARSITSSLARCAMIQSKAHTHRQRAVVCAWTHIWTLAICSFGCVVLADDVLSLGPPQAMALSLGKWSQVNSDSLGQYAGDVVVIGTLAGDFFGTWEHYGLFLDICYHLVNFDRSTILSGWSDSRARVCVGQLVR